MKKTVHSQQLLQNNHSCGFLAMGEPVVQRVR